MNEKNLTSQIPVCERLKAARKGRGYKNANDFADELGINRGTYTQHESGKRNVKEPALERYSKALGISKEWLKSGNGMPSSALGMGDINAEILRALEPAKISLAIATPSAYVDAQLLAAIFEFFLKAIESMKLKVDAAKLGNMAAELYETAMRNSADPDHRLETLPLLAKPYLHLLKHLG